ncbi:MAG: HAMP domain-containing sensor histidine kinase [Anaerolineaceae bacterium]|nr:HAMP domain-containing sensor histidine kinase [Anaerolineaceae bacterium]
MPRNHWSPHQPPWWPENETWPPVGPAQQRGWRSRRIKFFRRIGCGFVAFSLFLLVGTTSLFWLVNSITGTPNHFTGWFPVLRGVGLFLILLFLAIIFTTGRALRRAALPVGDLLEAVGRIEAGDYSVRVREGGPGEVKALARAFNSMAEELQTNDEQRRNLLADITHELRTPITVIQGNLEGMLDGIYPPDPDRIDSILEETRLLSRVIDDLRTLSLAEGGSLKLQIEPAGVDELICDLAASFEPQAKAAGIHLKTQVQPGLPVLEIDPTRIREVLTNLLANALRYTPAGGEIEISNWQVSSEPDKVFFQVRDSGAGIPPEDLPHIFERFYKSSDSHGTGLGLAISKSLVNAHHGGITATSQPGHGTLVQFWLPVPEQNR